MHLEGQDQHTYTLVDTWQQRREFMDSIRFFICRNPWQHNHNDQQIITDATNIKVFGSNTGSFSGEEVEVADFSGGREATFNHSHKTFDILKEGQATKSIHDGPNTSSAMLH